MVKVKLASRSSRSATSCGASFPSRCVRLRAECCPSAPPAGATPAGWRDRAAATDARHRPPPPELPGRRALVGHPAGDAEHRQL
eukprot:scaffold1704_cov100-Isochrysis_galbana.AAC.6